MSESALKKTTEDFLADGHTPMMAQYHAIKENYPDCLLFYRMGDFYELFFEDAEKAASILDITLTRRGKNKGEDIPMAGVPFHSYEPYLARLIRAGCKVAICEQTESPEEAKKRGGHKALVQRDVVRVVTAGTITEDNLLKSRANNYLAAIADIGGQIGLAWLDISTGAFKVQPVQKKHLLSALESIDASEYLIADTLNERAGIEEFFAGEQKQVTLQPKTVFDYQNARKRLEDMFGVETLESFGAFSWAEIAASGALLDYAQRTQVGKLPHLSRPVRIDSGKVMEIDAATRKNLEIIRTISGEQTGSLLHTIDLTCTGPGGRMLQSFLSAPLCDVDEIETRQDIVEALYESRPLRSHLSELFKSLPDLERAMARLTVGRGGPRDLLALREGLEISGQVRQRLMQTDSDSLLRYESVLKKSEGLHEYTDLLRQALDDEPPALTREGGFIRAGYKPALDELRSLRDGSKRLIADLQGRYAKETGIDKLKISFNNMLGYFIEVPAKKADALMVRKEDGDNPFVHRQTMANAVRFTTPELADLESRIASASERALAMEIDIFNELVSSLSALSEEIGGHARSLAELDVFSSLAELAEQRRFTRPKVDNSLTFDISEGRHPVVEHALSRQSEKFIPNDCGLGSGQRIWLLTGPNMAGKSTFLRQNALIAIMAQIGSFVPASSAHIGVIDRCFSRVGASDDLARGRSTFMVEMVETAAILNQSGERSLVILDEIGRGTATFDGLSIAWACVEHLHENNRCRALFATHYHELTSLHSRLEDLACYSMQVKEWKGDIVFMHSVGEGAADRSYGIHVGKLAGLPESVIDRAEEVLSLLQEGEQGSALTRLCEDLPLFSSATAAGKKSPQKSRLEEKLGEINPDDLSPKEALEALYELKEVMDR